MSNTNNDELISLYSHIDGSSGRDIELQPGTLKDQLAEASQYLQYSSVHVPIHSDNIKWVAYQAAAELEKAVEWLNEASNQDDLYFRVGFSDGNNFGARIDENRARNSSIRDCLITIRLGSIPLLIGIGNRLNTLSQSPLLASIMLGHSDRDFGVIPFDPEIDPIGSTVWEQDTQSGMDHTLANVVNALLLMFFHEASHGCAAHGYIWNKRKDDLLEAQYHRAMEMEADWGAGMLYVKYRSATSNYDARTLCKQLLYGSQCNYLGLQIARGLTGGPDTHYHLPHTRTHCTLYGAQQAWEAITCFDQSFVDLINEAYASIDLVEKLFSKKIKGWLSYDNARSERDMAGSRSISRPMIDELQKSHAYKRARPFDILKGLPAAI
ncbi:hypothetical protein ACFPOU_23665 [Massilia jejuensis]|uniref:Uncharacterized protein n=1 Tax=Massilia jejuensis TaxID=648894 RepID=A0ABW0PUR2_9BURK